MAKNIRDDDILFVESLTKVLKKNNLTELEISRDYGDEKGISVRLSQRHNADHDTTVTKIPIITEIETKTTEKKSKASDDPALSSGAVTSPMVGTCFLQPEPGSQPFVRVGENVIEGQTLLIIEAMKTMNHIPASKTGIIKRILVEDGTPVEFGAPLMIIE
ncbi:MAG: acetyl-CoA carboxylase biotin carboxyl carrier protein [Paracoccaceae bacterium]